MSDKEQFFSCVQCVERTTGLTGDFISKGDKIAVSPIFGGLVELYKWMRENGWRSVPGSYSLVERVDPRAEAIRLWDAFSDVPITNAGRTLVDFEGFSAGTDREVIWQWLENLSPDLSVAERMGIA